MDNQIVLARKDLKKNNYWMLALMITSLVLIILSFKGILTARLMNEPHIDYVRGYQSGLSFALFVFPCINLISNHFLAKNETKLLNKYINDHDERKLFIADKIGRNFSFTLEIIILALLSIVAPLYSFDLLIGITLCIYVIALIRLGLYIYYNKKYWKIVLKIFHYHLNLCLLYYLNYAHQIDGMRRKNMLKVENLTKTFKKVNAVENVSFEVNPGEIIGLLGENGAGKTTTLRMVATMLKPTSGNVIIDEYNIIDNPSRIREKIGILFGGDVALYDRLTGRENMTYFAKLNGMNDKEAKNAVDQIARDLEMVDYINRPVGKYSRGMKQKVSLARSIIHHPDVMLFDEPTTGLDVMSSKLIHDFILKCKKENKAIVFSSHNMYETEKLCDRIIIIHKGKIVASGTIEQLKNDYQKDNLEELFIECIGGENNE